MPIDQVHIRNFKSIYKADVKLASINVLIGANGAGKSNFIKVFELVSEVFHQTLQPYVNRKGKADRFLRLGSSVSSFIQIDLDFIDDEDRLTNSYGVELVPDVQNNLSVDKEMSRYNKAFNQLGGKDWSVYEYPSANGESGIKNSNSYRDAYLRNYLGSFVIYHFHDTSDTSPLKKGCSLRDHRMLRRDGSNLPAILYKLKKNHFVNYQLILRTVQSIAPFIREFTLEPDELDEEYITLEWLEKDSDDYFNAHDLSDGTLRFLAFCTLLLQPELPKTIIIDEPELGLHPFAIRKLAGLIRSASNRCQLIISTQSVTFLNHFDAEEVIVVDRNEQGSVFRQLEQCELNHWLDEYTVGEIWEKNVIGGQPQ